MVSVSIDPRPSFISIRMEDGLGSIDTDTIRATCRLYLDDLGSLSSSLPGFTDADYIGPVDMRGLVVDKEVYRRVFKKATVRQRMGLSVGNFIGTNVKVLGLTEGDLLNRRD